MEYKEFLITQKYYSNLEIDVTEKDIIQIWMKEKNDSQVVMIERKNLKQLTKIITKQVVSV